MNKLCEFERTYFKKKNKFSEKSSGRRCRIRSTLLSPGFSPPGAMLGNPVIHRVNVTDIVAGAFAQKPFVPHYLLALSRSLTKQARLRRDRLNQPRRTQSLPRFRRTGCSFRFHTLAICSETAFFQAKNLSVHARKRPPCPAKFPSSVSTAPFPIQNLSGTCTLPRERSRRTPCRRASVRCA